LAPDSTLLCWQAELKLWQGKLATKLKTKTKPKLEKQTQSS
jgi:hypothetical protein